MVFLLPLAFLQIGAGPLDAGPVKLQLCSVKIRHLAGHLKSKCADTLWESLDEPFPLQPTWLGRGSQSRLRFVICWERMMPSSYKGDYISIWIENWRNLVFEGRSGLESWNFKPHAKIYWSLQWKGNMYEKPYHYILTTSHPLAHQLWTMCAMMIWHCNWNLWLAQFIRQTATQCHIWSIWLAKMCNCGFTTWQCGRHGPSTTMTSEEGTGVVE